MKARVGQAIMRLLDLAGIVLLTGVVLLWPISLDRADVFLWLRAGRSFAVVNSGGKLYAAVTQPGLLADQPPQWHHLVEKPYTIFFELEDRSPTAKVDARRFGFRWMETELNVPAPKDRLIIAAVPQWVTAVPAGLVLLARGWSALRRWYRWRHGLCGVCGYDLRESRDRCPECGTAIAMSLSRYPGRG